MRKTEENSIPGRAKSKKYKETDLKRFWRRQTTVFAFGIMLVLKGNVSVKPLLVTTSKSGNRYQLLKKKLEG